MQLKRKKIWVLSTIIVYCASFFLQSNFVLFEAWAKEVNEPRVNIVAILVDDGIYDSIAWWLQWYTTNYIQQQLSDTKALVMPLNLSKISAYDIYRMLENVYFDWLENVNSTLIWLILVWDVPLPVVNQDGYVFPTIYPYVDFENQKYVWDSETQYFIPNGNTAWQAEVWHWLINYWSDANAYMDFFGKIKKYMDDPDAFIWDSMWYEDFIAAKEWFLNENYKYYRNKIMFGEDLWYQRYSPLMKKLVNDESNNDALSLVGELSSALDTDLWWGALDGWDTIHTTKLIQQEMETNFLADYNELFSKVGLSTMRENVFAWWRWIKNYTGTDWKQVQIADSDSSAAMIQLKDTMYLWTEKLQWLIENVNMLMENMIDKKIEDEKYSMDIVVPIEYKKIEWKRIFFICYPFVTRFENYYFGKNARFIEDSKELSIYRWTFRNLSSLDWLKYGDLLTGDNPAVSKLDKTDIKLKSIWASYDIFSNQAEWNRWYYMLSASNDVNTYEENQIKNPDKAPTYKVMTLYPIVRKKEWPENCSEKKCETLTWFASRWRWWASSINIDTWAVNKWRYVLNNYTATDAWRSIYDMWWFQSLLSGDDEWMNWRWWVNWQWVWPQTAATSFKSYIKYASPTEIEWWKVELWVTYTPPYYRPNFYIWEDAKPNVHMAFTWMNYWDLNVGVLSLWKFKKESDKIFNIIFDWINTEGRAIDLTCNLKKQYTYKFLSSIIKHDSVNEDEINWIDYDRYWEAGELWKNYYDIKIAYEDVDESINNSIISLSWLSEVIKSWNNQIKNWIDTLSGHADNLWKDNKTLESLINAINNLKNEISSMESDIKSLEAEIKNLESSKWDDEEENEKIDEDIKSCENKIASLKSSIASKETQIKAKEIQKNNIQWQIDSRNADVWEILKKVSSLISGENSTLSDVYSQIAWLFADNIIWSMEYIIYLQWWEPTDYLWSTVSDDMPKVPFLPEWITSINDLSDWVKDNVQNLISQYKIVYDLIVVQQTLWKQLATKLSAESTKKDEIKAVSEEMDNIFTVKSWDTDNEDFEDPECENNDCNTEHLVSNTASEKVGDFVDNLKLADLMFNNMTKVDTGWLAIISAALTDTDFLIRTRKKWINLSNMSGADIINQYAWWAKWDWIDSEWARRNRDLIAWASIHMSGMNILTPDRPIDSPRYVSMQSVAWNDIKLIYPDLFKVEVFVLTWKTKDWYDIHELLTWWQIKENLVEYLSWKVEEYNKILETEYKNALSSNIYFEKLSQFNPLATPNISKSVRPYNYFTYDEFVDAIWWTWMLDAIADILYYQNLTNKRKLSTGNIAEDINLIKESFGINDKREETLNNYLKTWNEEIYNPLIVIPNYELSWYEVAYVNSNGRDYIIPTQEEEVEITKSSSSKNVVIKKDAPQPTQQEEDLMDECNIPQSWRLPLFTLNGGTTWFQWFKCWWKKVKEEPFKIELSFDDSLWDLITLIWDRGVEWWLKDYLKQSKLWENFTSWGDAMSQYADAWHTIIGVTTWEDSSKEVWELEVIAELHNREVMWWDSWVSNALQDLYRNINISNSNWWLSDSRPTSILGIASSVDIWVVTVTFMWTWDWCLKINNDILCAWSTMSKTFNPKLKPFTWLVMSSDHKAWVFGLDIKIWLWGDYIEKVIRYNISPSDLASADIDVLDEKTVAWMISPVVVTWYDQYNNKISWALNKYDFIVDQWRFLINWSYKESFSTNDFRDLKFYYQAPPDAADGSEAVIQIVRSSDYSQVLQTYRQRLIQWNVEVKLDWKTILEKKQLQTNQSMRLRSNESIYDWWWKLIVQRLHKVDIAIKDMWWKVIDVDSQIIVTSQNWLVRIWQVQKQEGWDNIFFETSKHYMSWGEVTLYYYPTTAAWDDIINIDIPWLDSRIINLEVLPAPAYWVQIIPSEYVVQVGDSIDAEVFVHDIWGNTVDANPDVILLYDEDLLNTDPHATVHTQHWYWNFKITWLKWWLVFINWWAKVDGIEVAWNTQIIVDKHLFPETWLNIMYLNYFGNDRWNQRWYFSKNNKHVEYMMTNSDKIIATTTQLVSEDKIKKMSWKIAPGFKILNLDNLSTVLTIQWWRSKMIIWWITTMETSFPNVEWLKVSEDSIDTILSNESNASKNFGFFFPSNQAYSIKNWILYSWEDKIANLLNWDISFQLSRYTLNNWDNIWNLVDRWVNYWTIAFHRPNFNPSVWDFTKPWERYLVNETFTDGSTYALSSVWIFDWESNFELDTSYKSIQNSNDISESIWFLWDFKNITLFAEWEIVWEATKKFGSEFVINLWDPVLSRKWPNENIYLTDFDWWIWQEIYVDSENSIFWTYQIDFNNDGLEDLLVVYLDWTLKLAKNYWWSPDLRNMQELMRIAVWIKEVFAWDVNGDWYDDITVRTSNNQIRSYINNGWVFDVDWSVACLNTNVHNWDISSTPTDVWDLFQLFVEDMDRDGTLDIITYDKKWYIKVFYWWSTKWWPNYLSTLKYACDTWWYNREIGNTTLVTALWVNVIGKRIFDNSMLHRAWIIKEEIEVSEDELEDFWITFDEEMLKSWITTRDKDSDGSISKATTDMMENFDVSQATKSYMEEALKYQDVTLYETWLLWGKAWTYLFAPISYLDVEHCEKDKGMAWKTYKVKSWWAILQNWDIVTVTVTIMASPIDYFYWSFWDVIEWPWNVYYDKNNIITWTSFMSWINIWDSQRNGVVVKPKDWWFAYIVDNVRLSPGQSFSYTYDLEYQWIQLRKMDISYVTYWSNDKYPDIKLQSVDGCSKNFDAYIGGGRWFWYQLVALQDDINNIYKEEDRTTEDLAKKMTQVWSDVNQLSGVVWDKIGRISLLGGWDVIEISDDEDGKKELKNAILQRLADWTLDLWFDLDIDFSIFEEESDQIEEVVDTISKWMCNWFSFGWANNCPWLPVPFNQAFLAPWKYHLFWCIDLPLKFIEWWLPVFFFPSSMPGYPVVPIPWWQKFDGGDAWDKFFWPLGWWNYPSLIRIYAAPTLTAQLWLAICIGPYATSLALPSPVWDVAWNCIVFAIKPQCTKSEEGRDPNANYDNVYNETVEEIGDSWVCLQKQKWKQVVDYLNPSTPFMLYSYQWYQKQISEPKRPSIDNARWRNGDTYNVSLAWLVYDQEEKLDYDENEVDVDVSGWSRNWTEYSMNALWLISLETTATVWEDEDKPKNSIMIWNVDILWWDYNVNKIRWWIQQWIRKVIIDKWLDPQIRYIANQLTKMHIDVKLPNLGKLLSNEIGVIQNASNSIWEMLNSWSDNTSNSNISEINDTEDLYSAAYSTWKWITKDSVNQFNKKLANPFEQLAKLMDKSNIINISTETLTVNIPWIFPEDIDAYELYLTKWLDTNQDTIERWTQMHPEMSTQDERARLQMQIYNNIAVLEEYRNFPFEVYEWIHVIDRYMSEIMSLINNTIWYLSHRLSTNAERFSWYIDAITLIINIIKTYQLIIDFSVEWSDKCGNCARDTYDQYSCKLSIICDALELPIIQIPNFKLPNVTIDLSNMDLWLDIVLPKFNFQPIRIDLPDILNIPEPPSAELDVKLIDFPDIPLLPSPPELPDIPSFIPEIEIELPILPPAPEIPRIPNEIETLITVAKIIWKIYCIIKAGFGLVWEKSVKAKIEQITQRTYEVKWIDNIMDFTNRSAAPVKNYWVDYEISSYVDLQFDLTNFYDFMDVITKDINNLSTSVVKWVNKWIDVIENIGNAPMSVVDKISSIDVDLSATLIDLDKSDNKHAYIPEYEWLQSNEIEYVKYDEAKNRLEDVLAFFNKEINTTTLADDIWSSIKKIENQINTPNRIQPNEEWIKEMESEVVNYLNDRQNEYNQLAKLINEDYNWFLAMISSNEYDVSNVDDNKLLTFNVQLFDVDSSTKEKIANMNKNNPYEMLMSNKKDIVDWYRKAINSNTADELWLTQSQYLVMRDNIHSMRDKISTLYYITKPESSIALTSREWWNSVEKSLVASSDSARLWGDMRMALTVDPSIFTEWIYENAWDLWLSKVVNSETFTAKIADKHYKTNPYGYHDIILYDENGVYIKCADQRCNIPWWWGQYRKYYSHRISEIPHEETWIAFASDTKLKIADVDEEVKNWKVKWQSFDVLSFSRDLEDVDWYLIKLVERIDHSYEKLDFTSNIPVHYILALPQWTDLDKLYEDDVKLEILNNKNRELKELSWNEVVEIVYYDTYKDKWDITISNVERKWYYARITSLNLRDNTYNIDAPWSNQIVAWRQIVWDDQPPLAKQELIRQMIPELTSEWDDLEWFVWTYYTVKVTWKDNVALQYINISQNGKILDEKFTSEVEDTLKVENLFHFVREKETFDLLWIDQFWNKTEKTITVAYDIPDITVTDIIDNWDDTVAIIAELSQDIDQWNVSFQRRRGNIRKTMIKKNAICADIPIWPWEDIIIGTPYSKWNSIAMFDKDDNIIALMDPDTAEIKLLTWYDQTYDVAVRVQDSAVLQLHNKTDDSSTFSISMPTKECSKVVADWYIVVDLPEVWKMWMFNGWKAVYKDGTIILLISPTWHLYSEYGLEGFYDYDRELDAVILTLYQLSDLKHKNPIIVWLKVLPFLES
mgnify:CR=1 FL=1